ncbi:hypothetical protein M405DRAFT_134225 [Rhizopogon salebrosus TDB-379]|nr:hypothetical protein M405DRAFT_134225 [Rhizopogon salebrosus TDB-379]
MLRWRCRWLQIEVTLSTDLLSSIMVIELHHLRKDTLVRHSERGSLQGKRARELSRSGDHINNIVTPKLGCMTGLTFASVYFPGGVIRQCSHSCL